MDFLSWKPSEVVLFHFIALFQEWLFINIRWFQNALKDVAQQTEEPAVILTVAYQSSNNKTLHI